MNLRLLSKFLLATALTTVSSSFAQYTNGQAANRVLGQANFTSSGANGGGSANASVVRNPDGIAIDPASGKLFVADRTNNRVLRFASVTALASGSAAEAVIGQPDAETTSAGTTAAKLSTPFDVAIDSAGNLWVADTGNNRVLMFPSAATLSDGSSATIVLGQENFGSSSFGTSNATMDEPASVAVSSIGTLYVSDKSNNRVLSFVNASSKTNGAIANGLLGQNNFLSNTAAAGAAGLNGPSGLAVDSYGNLWVGDISNNRVLRFDSVASKPVGGSANVVLGQANFTSTGFATTQSGLNGPSGIDVDDAGRLYVCDFGNNRVLIFGNAPFLSSGAPATYVLGQNSFTTSTVVTPPSATSLLNPIGVSYLSGGYLWVSDFSNNRLVSYTATPGAPNVRTTPANPKIPVSKTKRVKFVIPNNGSPDSFVLQVTASKKTSSKVESVTYKFQGETVTGSITTTGITTSEIPTGGSVTVQMVIATGEKAGRFKPVLTATSVTNPSISASKKANIKIEAN